MKLFIKFIAIILLASFLISCVSRKKQLQKEKSEIEVKRKLDSVTFSKITSEKKKVEAVAEKETQKEKVIEYEGKAGDSLKVIEKGADGNIISETIITGTGKAIIKNKETTLNKIVNKVEEAIDIVENKAEVKLEELKKEHAVAKNKDVKTSGFTFTTWLWIIGIIAVVVVNENNNWVEYANLIELAIKKANILGADIIPVWQHIDRYATYDYGTATDLSADNNSKKGTSLDTVHPTAFCAKQYANVLSNYIANKL